MSNAKARTALYPAGAIAAGVRFGPRRRRESAGGVGSFDVVPFLTAAAGFVVGVCLGEVITRRAVESGRSVIDPPLWMSAPAGRGVQPVVIDLRADEAAGVEDPIHQP